MKKIDLMRAEGSSAKGSNNLKKRMRDYGMNNKQDATVGDNSNEE
jgi:hypothetical protein